ncbi:hypothetical protein Tco_1348476 [Tanacetum coccineum]
MLTNNGGRGCGCSNPGGGCEKRGGGGCSNLGGGCDIRSANGFEGLGGQLFTGDTYGSLEMDFDGERDLPLGDGDGVLFFGVPH